MQFRLRTLLLALAIGPPVVAWWQGSLAISLDTWCNAMLALGWGLLVFGLWCICGPLILAQLSRCKT